MAWDLRRAGQFSFDWMRYQTSTAMCLSLVEISEEYNSVFAIASKPRMERQAACDRGWDIRGVRQYVWNWLRYQNTCITLMLLWLLEPVTSWISEMYDNLHETGRDIISVRQCACDWLISQRKMTLCPWLVEISEEYDCVLLIAWDLNKLRQCTCAVTSWDLRLLQQSAWDGWDAKRMVVTGWFLRGARSCLFEISGEITIVCMSMVEISEEYNSVCGFVRVQRRVRPEVCDLMRSQKGTAMCVKLVKVHASDEYACDG